METLFYTMKSNRSTTQSKPIKSRKPANVLVSLEKFADKNVKKDVDYTIKRLHELICDPVNRQNTVWINRLLNNYLQHIESTGFKVKHLPAVMQILEFLSCKGLEQPEYNDQLNAIIHFCAYPPLLEKYSENLLCSQVLDQYFSVLGYVAVILSDRNDVTVLKAINELLSRSSKSIPRNIAAVKLELCHGAAERSKISTILTELTSICSSQIYKHVLETVNIVASLSNNCCHQMLAAGILNHLLFRFHESPQEDLNMSLDDNKINEAIVTTNILWLLMKSILPPEKLPDSLKNLPAPSRNSMRSMRNFFRIIVFGKRCNSKIIMIRNDLTAIMLAGLITLPSLPLINFHLADDIIKITAMNMKHNTDDLIFNKTLLLIIGQFSKYHRLVPIIVDHCVVKYILQLIENADNTTKVPQIYPHSYLLPYALQTLTFLVSKMPEEFVKYKGSYKLLKILERRAATAINAKDTLEIVKTIGSIVANNNTILLADFLQANAVDIITHIIENVSFFDQLTMYQQRIVTLLIIVVEMFLNYDKKLVEIHGQQMIGIFVKYLEKYLQSEKNNYFIDDRLLVTVGSCLWECVICDPTLIEKFIKIGGIYLILDIIEKVNCHVQAIYLGFLIDLCSDSLGIPHICTWRGVDKNKGLLSLLVKLWRDEEKRLGVRRTRDGCIDDLELPLMGTVQWQQSHISKPHQDFSPAIAAMFGSLRPKIYSIRQILLNNSAIWEQSKEHYKILHNDFSVENSITFCIIDQYFRLAQGEIWAEVLHYMLQAGLIPVGTDGEMLLVMRQRHRQCAAYVQQRQEKLLRDVKRREMIEEQAEFNKIRDVIFAETLKKLEYIDYIRRTADVEYRRRMKHEKLVPKNNNNNNSTE